jgi:bifunctional oligoribonuclease and PAP phosphatase NrnA
MRENNSFKEIFNQINNSKNILLSLHLGPDGDSLGSCISLKYFLEKFLNKKVKLISSDMISENLTNFPFVSNIEFNKDISKIDFNKEKFDLVICLDIGSLEMLSKDENFKFFEDLFVINIDHHETNTFFGNLNYVDPRKSSTCSVLLDFFNFIEFNIDKELATSLLLGICTDTNFFRVRHSDLALIEAVNLIEKGADYSFILNNVLFKERLEVKKFLGVIINNLKFDKKRKLGYSILTYDEIKNLKLNSSELALGIDEIRGIDEFDFVLLLVETKDSIRGSFRSVKGVNTSLFSKELGGGGHKAASGFKLNKMDLKLAKIKIFDVIDKIGISKGM